MSTLTQPVAFITSAPALYDPGALSGSGTLTEAATPVEYLHMLGDNDNATGVAASILVEHDGDANVIQDYNFPPLKAVTGLLITAATGVTMKIRYQMVAVSGPLDGRDCAITIFNVETSETDFYYLPESASITDIEISLSDAEAMRFVGSSDTVPVLAMFPGPPYPPVYTTAGTRSIKVFELTYTGEFTIEGTVRNLVVNPSAEQNFDRAWVASNGVIETAVVWEV